MRAGKPKNERPNDEPRHQARELAEDEAAEREQERERGPAEDLGLEAPAVGEAAEPDTPGDEPALMRRSTPTGAGEEDPERRG